MFQIYIEPESLPNNKISKANISLLNKTHHSPLIIHFRLEFPNSVLHIGGSIRSVSAIKLEKDIPFKHQIELKPQRLGEFFLIAKITCLNLRNLSQLTKIPFQVVNAHQEVILETNRSGSIEEKDSTSLNCTQHKSSWLIVELVRTHFNVSDLKDLCFKLGIEYEDLPGSTRKDKARELIKYLEQHLMLDKFVDVCRDERPNVEWPETRID